MAYSNDFKSFFPNFNFRIERGYVNYREYGTGAKVKSVTWNYPLFHVLDPDIVKACKSVFDAAKSHSIFGHDTDGIFICEKESKKYLIFTEMKSTFSSQEIFSAQEQIISSFIKINLLANLLPGYKTEDFKVLGFIFSLPPSSQNYINNLRKAIALGSNSQWNKEAEFTADLKIYKKTKFKPYNLKSIQGLNFGERGIFPEIEFHHIEVKSTNGSINLDLDPYLT